MGAGDTLTLTVDTLPYKATFGVSPHLNTALADIADSLNSAGKGITATPGTGSLTIENTTGEDFVVQVEDSAGLLTKASARGYNSDGDLTGPAIVDIISSAVTVSGIVQFEAEDPDITYTVSSSIDASAGSLTGANFAGDTVSGTITSSGTVDTVDISTYEGAQAAIGIIDDAIADIDEQRGNLGAIQNRFQHTIFNLQSIRENMTASRGRVKDTDYASEMAEMTKQQILKQASIANLAQANELARDVLYLLG